MTEELTDIERDSHRPLSTLLSHALIAFTIELDNEFEARMPHRTTARGKTPGAKYAPWLVSMAMWSNCMRFVDETGISVRKLEQFARTPTNLNGMERWGYVTVEPAPTDPRPRPPQADWMVRPKPGGLRAREVWRPLFPEIESRWRGRFGEENVNSLLGALSSIVGRLDFDLPDCLPILGYGMTARLDPRPRHPADPDHSESTLPSFLARVLMTLTLDFEAQSTVSLAICANILRIAATPILIRDMPRLSSVSKEAIAMSIGYLERCGCATVESGRDRTFVLTEKGFEARDRYLDLIWKVEEGLRTRFGNDAIEDLRHVLEVVAGVDSIDARLLDGIRPPKEGWRASSIKPADLPHYPMVLHRGGYPDGA